jgi:menaquinone-dependent protoporphyrinogen IX oxidase
MDSVATPRVLVVCATRHGSTAEVADAIAAELRAAGARVDVRAAVDGGAPVGYDAVIIGGPMIMGWHKDALKYVKRHREMLAGMPVTYFITAASLTAVDDATVDGVPIVTDSWLVKEPRDAAKLGYKERYALPSHYLGDILKASAPLRPASAAFFAGSLDLTKMNILEKLFVTLVVGATPGDGRHWDAIREWARSLPPQLLGTQAQERLSRSV